MGAIVAAVCRPPHAPSYSKNGGAHFSPAFFHGLLVAYGPDVKTMYAQAAVLATKIVGGQSPALTPVERPTRFTLSFNLKTARALGLTIPPTLLARAEDVID